MLEDSSPLKMGNFIWKDYPIYRSENNNNDIKKYAVVIVGGGPVGLFCSLLLAEYGIRSVVIERDTRVSIGSRAICISRRSLEVLDIVDVAESLVDIGLPWSSGDSYLGTEKIFEFTMELRSGAKFPPMINIEQYYIENELLQKIDEINKTGDWIDVRWGNSCDNLEFARDGSCVLAINDGLTRYSITAQYIIAADGAHSSLRKLCGLKMQGRVYESKYIITDIETSIDWPARRKAWFNPPWNRGTTVLMHKQPDNIWRIDYQLQKGKKLEDALKRENIEQFINAHLSGIGLRDKSWNLVWSTSYHASALTLENYIHRNVFFVGDAAHTLPIFGVRGLNSGLDDAANLSWKLASVINKKRDKKLLESYNEERQEAFKVNAFNASKSTEFMSPPNRGFEIMRNAALSLATRSTEIANLVNPRQTKPISYKVRHQGEMFDFLSINNLKPGDPIRDIKLEDGSHLIDKISKYDISLITIKNLSLARKFTDWRFTIDQNEIPCVISNIIPDVKSEWAKYYVSGGDVVYLIRPDLYIFDVLRNPTVRDVINTLNKY